MSIQTIATSIICGKSQTGFDRKQQLASFACQRPLSAGVIRQLFFLDTIEKIKDLLPNKLGRLVAEGQNLCPKGDYRDQTLVFSGGTRGYWEITLSEYDSGLVLLQKLAAASILARIIDLIILICPKGLEPIDVEPWTPFEIFQLIKGDSSLIDSESERIAVLKKELNWN